MPTNTTFPPAPLPIEQPWKPEEVKPSALDGYAKTGDVMPKAASITGYSAEKKQTLNNDHGTLKWVDAEETGE